MSQSLDYDRLAAEYARNRQVHPGVLGDLIATGDIGPESRVLEVGCGTGNYIVALAAAAQCACWGSDPSEQMLARAAGRDPGIHLLPGRAERLEFPAVFFDLVFSVDVIHHVVDRAAYFREAHRALKPGGRICTVTDSEWIIRHREPLSVYFPETVEVDLARYPRLEELAALMLEAGLEGPHEAMVESPYTVCDSQPYRERAFSSLHLIGPDAFQRGLRHLEEDLCHGPVAGVSRYVLLWGMKPEPGGGSCGVRRVLRQ